MYGCTLRELSSHSEPRINGVAVSVHARSSVHLSGTSIAGMDYGVCIDTHASATLCGCTVSYTVRECVLFTGAATGTLDKCTLSGSQTKPGLVVADAGTRVCAVHCHFLGSMGKITMGAFIYHGSALTADACTSSGHETAGYCVHQEGTRWSSPTAVATATSVAVW